MSLRIGVRRLLRESAPIAVILLFWSLLASVPNGIIETGFQLAAVLMGLLYVVVRGVQLAEPDFASPPADLGGLLRENGLVALTASVWFLAALLASATKALWSTLSYMESPFGEAVDAFAHAANGAADLLALVFTGTGVATVILYAVASGLSRIRYPTPEAGTSGSADVRADD